MRLLITTFAFVLLSTIGGLCTPQTETQPVPEPRQQEPSTTPQPQPPPNNQAGPASSPTDTQPSVQAPPASKPSVIKPKSRKKKRSTTHPSTDKQSGKVIVRDGGAREGAAQISPAMSKDQQQRERETTAQLLSTTDANLKKIEARQLTTSQQGMLRQVRTYMQQSKAASEAGDLERAGNLALKAHLLSDDLLRR